MPINASYEFFEAEKKYLQAQTIELKIASLEEMIRAAPKHKGSENLLSELKTRLRKLKEKKEKNKKTGSRRPGLKKEGFQVVLVGFTNVGKSQLLESLTNASSPSAPTMFTTNAPVIGAMEFEGVRAQIVDLPSVGSSFFDIGIVNTADCILEVVDSFDQLQKLDEQLIKSHGKRIVVFTKLDVYSESERTKLFARASSKKLKAIFVSPLTKEGILELKRAIFLSMDSIRIFTKEPGKPPSSLPVVLPSGSTIKDVAESIYKGFSSSVREIRITGPSAHFANQKVGLKHVVKDRDTVEFKTR